MNSLLNPDIQPGIDIFAETVEFTDTWDSIDSLGVWDCMLTEFSMMEFVPRQHLEVWVWINGEILRRMRGAEGRELDRTLKWFAMIPQLLLRVPLRHGKPGRINVANRFQAVVDAKWGKLLKYWVNDKRKLREEKEKRMSRRRPEN